MEDASGNLVQKVGHQPRGTISDSPQESLRHTYTMDLLPNGAQPKDVQEFLGHSDVSTTMNVYAHATREAEHTAKS